MKGLFHLVWLAWRPFLSSKSFEIGLWTRSKGEESRSEKEASAASRDEYISACCSGSGEASTRAGTSENEAGNPMKSHETH